MNVESVGRVVTDYCELKEVLYVPQLSKNILLVGSIMRNGGEVNFTKNEVAVIKENEVLIRGRKGANGLYVVTITRDSIPEALVAEHKNLEMTWHRRLGHISQDCLKVVSRIVEGMNLITPNSWNKKKYIVTFTDGFTYFSEIHLLELKTEVPELVIRHIRKIERQAWTNVEGIVIDTSAQYTPQHQGTAERFNRTLLDKVRALMLDSAAPEDLWSEAAYTATYLINRSQTKGQSETPAELWYGKKPDVSNLRIFGCEAYSKIDRHQLKFKQRNQKTCEDTVGIQERASKRNRRTPVRYEDYVMLKYEEALSYPEGRHWKVAVEEEKQALIKNETWTVVKKEKCPGSTENTDEQMDT
ncbi:hypothetical protein PR048_002702 [Dryococelus australis]|uniref:Integrase catalytic domain-containing protein n=1 Tax=Dryococelus australis TaxID=614101 RepID=A0ABQ9IL18_9NEOP|nr:hypothetical protein PR048_002702 [Dryococelus australis]